MSVAPLADRTGALALAFQEAMTVVCRLQSNRQVASDANQFRQHIKGLLGRADEEARAMGYDAGDVKLAIYALVALLDESVLRSPQTIFSGWAGQPLQEEVFGDHMAGETFFRNLGELMHRPDSPSLADVLEVHELCLLLGFRGRYAHADDASLNSTISAVQERINRIRGWPAGFTEAWQIPQETLPVPGDPWVRRLAIIAVVAFLIAGVLWLAFQTGLGSAADQLSTFA